MQKEHGEHLFLNSHEPDASITVPDDEEARSCLQSLFHRLTQTGDGGFIEEEVCGTYGFFPDGQKFFLMGMAFLRNFLNHRPSPAAETHF